MMSLHNCVEHHKHEVLNRKIFYVISLNLFFAFSLGDIVDIQILFRLNFRCIFTHKSAPLVPYQVVSLSSIIIPLEVVYEKHNHRLNANTVFVPDSIHLLVPKKCPKEVAYILSDRIPYTWKQDVITSVYNGYDRQNASNYCIICLFLFYVKHLNASLVNKWCSF